MTGWLVFIGFLAALVGFYTVLIVTAFGPDTGLVEDREVQWLEAVWEMPEHDPETSV